MHYSKTLFTGHQSKSKRSQKETTFWTESTFWHQKYVSKPKVRFETMEETELLIKSGTVYWLNSQDWFKKLFWELYLLLTKTHSSKNWANWTKDKVTFGGNSYPVFLIFNEEWAFKTTFFYQTALEVGIWWKFGSLSVWQSHAKKKFNVWTGV